MGLDMTLSFKWHNIIPEDTKAMLILDGDNKTPFASFEMLNAEFEIISWRKMNAIHRWFVEHVQDEHDDCGEYLVSLQNLNELMDTIKTVLENKSKAPELLPTMDGFFFGSTDYDEYYFKELERTLAQLQKFIEYYTENKAYVHILYTSSW